MYREVWDDVYWFQELGPHRDDFVQSFDDDQAWYVPGEDVYVPQNAYLFRGDESLLFDTTSPANTETILADLEEILDGRTLDYLVVSHPDIPHSGNTHAILERYPEATLVAPSVGSLHELYHLGAAEQMDVGESIDLGGFRVTFEEAPVVDAAMTFWMSEETTDSLYTVDWMCFPHMGRETLKCADEIDSEVSVERLIQFSGRVIFWLQYVDPDVTIEAIERFVDDHPVSAIAPSHGLIIPERAVEHMRRYRDVVTRVSDRGRISTI